MRNLLQIWVCASVVLALVVSVVLLGKQADGQMPQKDAEVLRLAVPYSAQHPTAQAATAFAQLVQKESGGMLSVELFFDKELGSCAALLEQLQFGGVALAVVDSVTAAQQMPALSTLLTTDPGSTPQQTQQSLHTRQSALDDLLAKEQISLLAVYTPDYRCIVTAQTPTRAPQDLLHLRLVQPGPVAIAGGALSFVLEQEELVQSVTNDFVDGAEMGLLEYMAGDYEAVMPYLTVQTQAYSVDLLLASEASLGFLSASNQELLARLAAETIGAQQQALAESQQQSLNKLAASKVVLYPPLLLQTPLSDWPSMLADYPWLSGGEGDD